ncbi:MAG: hypothetical protein HXS54_15980 [Theionarchaea archaeon]|nr:hypothetical protein [Theionarchaea archaeon]
MQHRELSRSQSDNGTVCAICHKSVKVCDYRDQKLNLNHVITLTIVAIAGDAFLPHAIEVHGECLKGLQQELMEKNRRYTWR